MLAYVHGLKAYVFSFKDYILYLVGFFFPCLSRNDAALTHEAHFKKALHKLQGHFDVINLFWTAR